MDNKHKDPVLFHHLSLALRKIYCIIVTIQWKVTVMILNSYVGLDQGVYRLWGIKKIRI